MKRTRIRKVGTRRAAELRIYTVKRKAYMALHPYCEVFIKENQLDEAKVIANGGWDWYKLEAITVPLAVDIHHMAGRTGWRLNDDTKWMSVCRRFHESIHNNPKWARARGYLI